MGALKILNSAVYGQGANEWIFEGDIVNGWWRFAEDDYFDISEKCPSASVDKIVNRGISEAGVRWFLDYLGS